MTTRRALALMCLAATLVLATVQTTAPSSAYDEDITASNGAISRGQLLQGFQQLVRDEAIEAANSPEFVAALRAWDDDSEFVAQLDYQLEFRAKVDFMNRDYAHIAQLLLEKPVNMGSESMGLFMSHAEVSEMQRRDTLGDRMETVVELVAGVREQDVEEGSLPDYGPNFGGIWQDQLDGGRIVLAVVDASSLDVPAIADVLGGREHLTIVEQNFTYNQIETYRTQLEEAMDELGIARDIAAVRSHRGRLLEVRVADLAAVPDRFGASVPSGAFTIVEGSVVRQAGYPSNTHSLADQQPGLQIYTFDESTGIGEPCTWAFNGHTAGYHYLVTAGHCMPADYENYSGAWVGGDVEVYQNNNTSRNLTPGDTFVRSLDNATYDLARLESSYADDNCYHGNPSLSSPAPHCAWPMAHRALHNSWEIGSDRTCASLGMSNTYRCGYILEENHSGGNRVRTDLYAILGDSGAGMKWDYRIDGILTDVTYPNYGESFFQTAYHAQYALGNGYFYFNCYSPGSIVRSNPADWGTCPSVNA